MTSIKTIMIPSDYKGDKCNSKDCIGNRAFKRALKQLPWYKKLFITTSWYDTYNFGKRNWHSFKNKQLIDMMHSTKIGDEITFIKNG